MQRRSASDAVLSAQRELKDQIRVLVKDSIKERIGPSFDERLQQAVSRRTLVMKEQEREQRQRLTEARTKGERRAHDASPIGAFMRSGEAPNEEKQAALLEGRRSKMRDQAREYREHTARLKESLRTREPLFRVSEVAAAQKALRDQSQKRKRELHEEEKKRWAHIADINRSVLTRPLLMDSTGGLAPAPMPGSGRGTRPQSAPCATRKLTG
eukprot:TRINITY_DN24981_c0_g1_i1.p1 TRINITY_DN24981_c0_g1~~TRINITY_DN24981_c0_g1_i1.p1  ORF type:complete len:212 (-),score=53.72 TRINITY_DN24981_c0_g1_i1:55-690(-)